MSGRAIRTWRSLLVTLALTLIVLPAAGRAERLGQAIESGAWTGGAYAVEGGGFGYCAVAASYNSGVTLLLGLEPGNFFIGLTNEAWTLGSGTSYPLTLDIDRRSARSVSAIADGDTIWIELGEDAAFYRAVQQGALLTVDAAQQDFEFELKGTNAALNRVAACMIAYTGGSLIGDPYAKKDSGKPAGNPFGEAADAPAATGKAAAAGTPEVFDADEVIGLLEQAEFPRAMLLPQSSIPLFEGETPFMAWLSEDEDLPILGFLLYLEHTDQPREALADVIALVVASCPYAVASGLDPVVERAGVRVAGGKALCEGAESIEVTYFAAIARRRGVYVFAHSGEKSTQWMTRDINDRLKDALLGYSF